MSQELYQTMLFVAGGVNLLIALVLLMGNMDYRDYDIYRRSRRFIALCYVVFAIGFLLQASLGWRTSWPAGAAALSVTYFHVGAVLFGWSHISLLRPDYLTRSVLVRDIIILIASLTCNWLCATNSSIFNPQYSINVQSSIFFAHAGYIAYTFYRTYYLVRRSLMRMPAGGKAPDWWTMDAKREVLSGHHSFVIGAHLIILFGIGGIVVNVAVPTMVWPFILLTTVGILVFTYIFFSLTEYGWVIEAATCATEDAEMIH